MSADLVSTVRIIREFDATVVEAAEDNLGTHAIAYGNAGWAVFPARGKVPLTPHGVLDATCDLDQLVDWWTRWPRANIAGRVPAGIVVVDIDPRSGGDKGWTQLEQQHGPVETRCALSGRGDGGRHLYLRHPGGKLRGSIGTGLDVKTFAGYTILPPSRHPDSGQPYRWIDPAAPIAATPPWLAELLKRPAAAVAHRSTAIPRSYVGDSVADWYTTTHTWADVLTPHGWMLTSGSGDDDGSRWRHPTATHAWSATVKHGCLFVYSLNTPFETTDTEQTHGYTRFRAFAVLNHSGDLSAAARAAGLQRVAA